MSILNEFLSYTSIVMKYQKNQTTTNYEISKKTSNIKGEYAIIKRVTAAVAVDGKYVTKKEGEKSTISYQPRSQKEIQAITALVQQTIGYNSTRKDMVTVSNFEFRQSNDEIKVHLSPVELLLQKIRFMLGQIYPVLKYLFLAIVFLIFYKKVLSPFGEKMLELKTEEEDDDKVEIEFEEEEYEDDLDRLNEIRKKIESQLGAGADDEDSVRYDILLEKIKITAEEHPEEIANIVQQLMQDEMAKKSG